MGLETHIYKKLRGPILLLPHMYCVIMPVHIACLGHILYFTVPTPLPMSFPSTSPAMLGKWAWLQESDWVDAIMSGHQAAAFLTRVRPQLPFPFPGKVHKVQVVSQAVRNTANALHGGPTQAQESVEENTSVSYGCVHHSCSPLSHP